MPIRVEEIRSRARQQAGDVPIGWFWLSLRLAGSEPRASASGVFPTLAPSRSRLGYTWKHVVLLNLPGVELHHLTQEGQAFRSLPLERVAADDRAEPAALTDRPHLGKERLVFGPRAA